MQLLEIERELAGPESAEALKRYDAILLALDARLKRALDAGLPPEEFTKCEKLKEATTIARKILRIATQN